MLRPRCPSHPRADVGGAGGGAPGESPLELCSLCPETGGEPWRWRRWPGREWGERTPGRAGQHHGCPRPRAVTRLCSRVPRGKTWPTRGQGSATTPRHRHTPDPPPRSWCGSWGRARCLLFPTSVRLYHQIRTDFYMSIVPQYRAVKNKMK